MSDLRKWRVAVSDALGSYTLSEPSVPKVFDPVEELSTQVCVLGVCMACFAFSVLKRNRVPPWSMDAPVLVA